MRHYLWAAQAAIVAGNREVACDFLRQALAEANRTHSRSRGKIMKALNFARRIGR